MTSGSNNDELAIATHLTRLSQFAETLDHELRSPTSSSCATFERPTLILTESTPDTRILVRVEGVLEAVLRDRAMRADSFGSVYLLNSGTGVSNGKEKLRIHGQTCRSVSPIHCVSILLCALFAQRWRQSWTKLAPLRNINGTPLSPNR